MKKIVCMFVFFTINSYSQNFDYSTYNLFLAKYVSEKGNVNYDKIITNKAELNAIIIQFEKTQPTEKWLKNEKTAYFINVYNAYTIKVVIDNYPVKSIKDINGVWNKKIITSGKSKISLSDVENKILRKLDDPRIHFAINCASYSCPNLVNAAFVPAILDKQLDTTTKSFINDKSKNIITTNEIKISKIFYWYSADFKSNTKTVINFINKYSNTKINASAKTSYLDYSWSLNK